MVARSRSHVYRATSRLRRSDSACGQAPPASRCIVSVAAGISTVSPRSPGTLRRQGSPLSALPGIADVRAVAVSAPRPGEFPLRDLVDEYRVALEVGGRSRRTIDWYGAYLDEYVTSREGPAGRRRSTISSRRPAGGGCSLFRQPVRAACSELHRRARANASCIRRMGPAGTGPQRPSACRPADPQAARRPRREPSGARDACPRRRGRRPLARSGAGPCHRSASPRQRPPAWRAGATPRWRSRPRRGSLPGRRQGGQGADRPDWRPEPPSDPSLARDSRCTEGGHARIRRPKGRGPIAAWRPAAHWPPGSCGGDLDSVLPTRPAS